MLEARTQASVAFFKLGAHSAALRPDFLRAMKLKVLLRKRGGARARAAGAETREFLERMLVVLPPGLFHRTATYLRVLFCVCIFSWLWPREG